MVKKYLLLILLIAAGVGPAFSEGGLSMELGISNIILQTREVIPPTDDNSSPYSIGDSYWAWTTAGSAAFSFKSAGNQNVKADMAFSFAFPETDLSTIAGSSAAGMTIALLSIDRAYVKARFPWVRLTAGKTRLGWGEGFVFNAGDIIFGSTDTSVDLTASEIRTDTEWLTAFNIPLGRFSFAEAVIIPPKYFTAGGRISETSAGGRLYTKLAGIKIEAGYFFDQGNKDDSGSVISLHKPYLALQGNLIADWYLSSSTDIPVNGEIKEKIKDSLNISGGLFHMLSLNSISSLTFRLEGLYRPFQSWIETAQLPGAEAPTYALLLYPEISWALTDTVNLSARAIWSPVDSSAMITAGAGWNVFEGFDLNCFALFNAGDSDDSFSWNKDDELWIPGTDIIDGMAIILGVNYIY